MLAVLEETAAAGCPALSIVFSPGVIGSIMARHGTPDQNDRWLRGIATGEDDGVFRDHRAGRRHQLEQH